MRSFPAFKGPTLRFNWFTIVASHGLSTNRISRGVAKFLACHIRVARPMGGAVVGGGMEGAWPVMEGWFSRPWTPPPLEPRAPGTGPWPRACHPLETNGRSLHVSDRFSRR